MVPRVEHASLAPKILRFFSFGFVIEADQGRDNFFPEFFGLMLAGSSRY
jgi:hypothetical protein